MFDLCFSVIDPRLIVWLGMALFVFLIGFLIITNLRIEKMKKEAVNATLLLTKLNHAIEQSPVSVGITDLSGNLEYVNHKFCDITGYKKEELLGQNPRVLKSGEMTSDGYQNLWETITKGGVWRGEFHNRRKNGELYWEWATISGLFDENGNIQSYIAVKEDITEKKKLQSLLLHSQKMDAIGQLAAGVAHEINTPIQYVSDNLTFFDDYFEASKLFFKKNNEILEALKINENQVSEDFKSVLEVYESADIDFFLSEIPVAMKQTKEGIANIARIVGAMKSFVRSNSEIKANVNINECIMNTIDVSRGQIKSIADIQYDLDEQIPSIFCFGNEIKQVLLQLLLNARDAIREVKDSGLINIKSYMVEEGVCIEVADDGAGMDHKTKKRLFDPFYTTKDVGEGTGQGLSICYSIIVKKHKGSIEFDSEKGVGTKFLIKIPVG